MSPIPNANIMFFYRVLVKGFLKDVKFHVLTMFVLFWQGGCVVLTTYILKSLSILRKIF